MFKNINPKTIVKTLFCYSNNSTQAQAVIRRSAIMSVKNKPRLFITQPIPKEAMSILTQHDREIAENQTLPLTRSKFLESVKACDALFCTLNEKIDKEVLDEAGLNLKVHIKFLQQLQLKQVKSLIIFI